MLTAALTIFLFAGPPKPAVWSAPSAELVEEGGLDHLDAVFALHVDPMHDVGTVATRAGAMMAAADSFKLVIHGSGGHAARPQGTIDPIALSAHVINAIQQVVSRRLKILLWAREAEMPVRVCIEEGKP